MRESMIEPITGSPMNKLRVLSFGFSLDGYGAGPSQDRNNPLGKGGHVHEMHLAVVPAILGNGRKPAL
jgi:hypothetical protein